MNPRKQQFDAARAAFKFPNSSLWLFEGHDELLRELQVNGWCKLPLTLPKHVVAQIVWDASQRDMYNAHVKAQSDGIPKRLPDLRSSAAHACLDTSDALRIKPLFDLCLEERILALASAYFESALPLCYSMNLWWSFPNNAATTTQGFHRDHDTFRFLSCFVFLSPTGGERGGEHLFVRHSHDEDMVDQHVPKLAFLNRITQEQAQRHDYALNPETISGQPGEVYLADTWAWHKAALPKADRLMAWFRYAINKPDSFGWDKLDQVRKLNPEGMSEVERHVLQLFI
jgi:hypothetical protein